MSKSKYIGKIINDMMILDTLNEINENQKKRHYFIVKCIKCNKVSKKDRFTLIKGQSCCECSYKFEHHEEKGKTRLYNIWTLMKSRCNNPKSFRYSLYGGRGIKVCDEWNKSYNVFHKWAKEHGYKDNLSIDRIDVDGNYEPSNCRWVTQTIQCNNSRRNHYLTYNGKTQSMSVWAKELGINYNTLRSRIYQHGWDTEKALTYNKKIS